jgi:hypothetical protein
MASEWHWVPCDVCRLVDGDQRPKWCFFCPACGAWICEDDASDWGRRARASALALRERFA